MKPVKRYPVPDAFAKRARITASMYESMYQASVTSPDAFWDEQAKHYVSWKTPWHTTRTGDFNTHDISWFIGGKLNACYNCVDRHLEARGHQTALIWEGNAPDEQKQLTYLELHDAVCRLANVLKASGIGVGDRVGIYLPMIPEAFIAMLACARIGAVHSVVFGGFSAEALANRLNDAQCQLLITADGSYRGEKTIDFKAEVDKALADAPSVREVLVVQRTGASIAWDASRDRWYHDALRAVSADCEPAWMDANAPLFILYTSGSTGKPKGILHTTGGYLVYATMTYALVFDHQDSDVYWCTADVGWITGHSYGVYGPLANGACVLLYEGVPHYPTPARFWEMIDRHKVTVFYTAPTALRSLRREGDAFVERAQRTSLRLLGSVGEPINPDVWEWYHDVIGRGHCPIVNTWWQTETGGILITPLPGATSLQAGAAGKPFFGIVPKVVDGRLVIKQPWPGMMKTVYGDNQRFIDTYLKEVPGAYLTGDLAVVDVSGDFWVKGRSDDVIQVSGHRLGTEEIESALVSSKEVSEAAVVGVPDAIKGESIYAFVTLKTDALPTDALKKALVSHVRSVIGPIATLDKIQWSEQLPKTRSGKIMRRLLRQIASGKTEAFGDVSTLAEPAVLKELVLGAREIRMKEVL
ncbi:MAG: acetate--CoA ligase [Legionellaceae bacterium]|nr:acetate--CoA ligase [Legionellaceae bacterium]